VLTTAIWCNRERPVVNPPLPKEPIMRYPGTRLFSVIVMLAVITGVFFAARAIADTVVGAGAAIGDSSCGHDSIVVKPRPG
jgi:hypothetical protein